MDQLFSSMANQEIPLDTVYSEYFANKGVDTTLIVAHLLPEMTTDDFNAAYYEDPHALALALALTYKMMIPNEEVPSHLVFLPLAQAFIDFEFEGHPQAITQAIGDFLATIQWYEEEDKDAGVDQAAHELTPPKKFPKNDQEIALFIRWAQVDITKRISNRGLPLDRPLFIRDSELVQLWPGAAKEHMLESLTDNQSWLSTDDNGVMMFDEFQVICIFAYKKYRDAVDFKILYKEFRRVFDRINSS